MFAPPLRVNPNGWVDACRFLKYMDYPWRARCAGEPIEFAHPHFWRERRRGRKKPIVVDSNCDEVELKVGERGCGVLKPAAANFHTVTFEGVTITRGALIGPPLYESDIARESSWLGTRYIDAPVSNLVCSTNRPGWIGVPVVIPARKTTRPLEP